VTRRSVDVVVVGGGLVGCALARALARRRLAVVVLERGRAGCEASAAAAGFLSPQADFAVDGPLVRLGIASREFYPRWARAVARESGIDPHWRRHGMLYAAVSVAEERALAARAAWQRRCGWRVERVSPRRARVLVPGLGPAVRSAVFFPDDASVDNERLAVAAALAARRAGATIREGCAVRRVLARGGRAIGVETAEETLLAATVVNAAGAWAAGIGVPRGGRPPSVVPVRGQMVVLRGLAGLVDRPLHGGRGYFAPRADGRVLVGSTYEHAGFDKRTTAQAVGELLAMAERLVPASAGAAVEGAYAGLRPGTSDALPIVGAAPGLAGLWYACGLYRNGVLLAPVVAEAVAELVTTGSTSWAIDAFAPGRRATPLTRRMPPDAGRARSRGPRRS
jgi:glycine oxidase